MVAVNSAIMFVISLATFIRFMVYVIRYWKQTAHEKDKILLVFMVFIIFSIFAGKLKLLYQSWLRIEIFNFRLDRKISEIPKSRGSRFEIRKISRKNPECEIPKNPGDRDRDLKIPKKSRNISSGKVRNRDVFIRNFFKYPGFGIFYSRDFNSGIRDFCLRYFRNVPGINATSLRFLSPGFGVIFLWDIPGAFSEIFSGDGISRVGISDKNQNLLLDNH